MLVITSTRFMVCLGLNNPILIAPHPLLLNHNILSIVKNTFFVTQTSLSSSFNPSIYNYAKIHIFIYKLRKKKVWNESEFQPGHAKITTKQNFNNNQPEKQSTPSENIKPKVHHSTRQTSLPNIPISIHSVLARAEQSSRDETTCSIRRTNGTAVEEAEKIYIKKEPRRAKTP